MTQLLICDSLSQAETRSPRFWLTAIRIGPTTCCTTNSVPTSSSGLTSGAPDWTAATVQPMAIAKTAGNMPASSSNSHQVKARPRWALGRTAKNFHSCRSRSQDTTSRLCHVDPTGLVIESLVNLGIEGNSGGEAVVDP